MTQENDTQNNNPATMFVGMKLISANPVPAPDDVKGDNKPGDLGYDVYYENGYTAWSPKAVFEEAYQAIRNGMSFGSAIFMLKRGRKVARKGWNGKDMFIYLSDGLNLDSKSLTGAAAKQLLPVLPGVPNSFKICPHIDMKAADGTIVVGWLASQTDMLADDWIVID